MKRIFLPEWHKQAAIQITWPHKETDWIENYPETLECYLNITSEISQRQDLIIVCYDTVEVKSFLSCYEEVNLERISFYEIKTNDTWARDHGAITILENHKPVLLDFKFNGWGKKFEWNLDNDITKNLVDHNLFGGFAEYKNLGDFVLEGGAIEYDGNGTILTTESCLLNPNRNSNMTRDEITQKLKDELGVQQIYFLKHGQIIGDDTDGHIDTLVRFCNSETIVYANCIDSSDDHFEELKEMKKELKQLKNIHNQPYKLVKIPIPDPVFDESGDRMPATYANFLIMNDVVLVPVYNVPTDSEAINVLNNVFTDKEIVTINCVPLIRQNGSLHCVTMQYPIECYGKK